MTRIKFCLQIQIPITLVYCKTLHRQGPKSIRAAMYNNRLSVLDGAWSTGQWHGGGGAGGGAGGGGGRAGGGSVAVHTVHTDGTVSDPSTQHRPQLERRSQLHLQRRRQMVFR